MEFVRLSTGAPFPSATEVDLVPGDVIVVQITGGGGGPAGGPLATATLNYNETAAEWTVLVTSFPFTASGTGTATGTFAMNVLSGGSQHTVTWPPNGFPSLQTSLLTNVEVPQLQMQLAPAPGA